ncbi:MAG TPA: hypothetical protein VIG90_15535 [Pedomonas sp.]|uniref:hypothetical protein n=1 Tax=Pedomonas sp. TaxID=2976421 RepID=UPI002F40A11D
MTYPDDVLKAALRACGLGDVTDPAAIEMASCQDRVRQCASAIMAERQRCADALEKLQRPALVIDEGAECFIQAVELGVAKEAILGQQEIKHAS